MLALNLRFPDHTVLSEREFAVAIRRPFERDDRRVRPEIPVEANLRPALYRLGRNGQIGAQRYRGADRGGRAAIFRRAILRISNGPGDRTSNQPKHGDDRGTHLHEL